CDRTTWPCDTHTPSDLDRFNWRKSTHTNTETFRLGRVQLEDAAQTHTHTHTHTHTYTHTHTHTHTQGGPGWGDVVGDCLAGMLTAARLKAVPVPVPASC